MSYCKSLDGQNLKITCLYRVLNHVGMISNEYSTSVFAKP